MCSGKVIYQGRIGTRPSYYISEDSFERLLEALAHSESLTSQSSFYSANLLHHLDLGSGKIAKPTYILESGLSSAYTKGPSRRLSDEEKPDEHETGWDELDGKRDDPL